MEKVAQLPILFAAGLEDLLANDATRFRLERDLLPVYVVEQRWFRSKTRKPARMVFESWTRFPLETENGSIFTVLKVVFDEGDAERYVLPLMSVPETDDSVPAGAILCRLFCQQGRRILIDATTSSEFRADLLRSLLNGFQMPLGNGMLKGFPFSDNLTLSDPNVAISSELAGGEQSNTSLLFSDHFLKLYRRLDEGVHPESEILRFLGKVRYPHVPSFQADLEWKRLGHPPVTVAIAQTRIKGGESGWDHLVNQLSPLARATRSFGIKDIPVSNELADWIRLLGRRTAGLHLALSSQPKDADFAPELLSLKDLAMARSSASRLLSGAIDVLKERDPESAGSVRSALSRLEQLEAALTREENPDLGNKIRVHGDLHLGQILRAGGDVWFLDFEGEPARSLAEKRLRHSPLRDVAGMLRSFHYVAHVASVQAIALPVALGEIFLEAYYDILDGSNLLPHDVRLRDTLLDIYVLEKAVYELHYELNNRPDWVEIPLRGLTALTRGH